MVIILKMNTSDTSWFPVDDKGFDLQLSEKTFYFYVNMN
jgi:hypothetical protein